MADNKCTGVFSSNNNRCKDCYDKSLCRLTNKAVERITEQLQQIQYSNTNNNQTMDIKADLQDFINIANALVENNNSLIQGFNSLINNVIELKTQINSIDLKMQSVQMAKITQDIKSIESNVQPNIENKINNIDTPILNNINSNVNTNILNEEQDQQVNTALQILNDNSDLSIYDGKLPDKVWVEKKNIFGKPTGKFKEINAR